MEGTGLHTVTVDGTNYHFAEWSVEKALEVLTWMAKQFGAPLATAVMGAMSKNPGKKDIKTLLDSNAEAMGGEAIGLLMANLSSQDVKDMMKAICVDDVLAGKGTPITMQHYGKKIGHMFKVSMEVVKYQYEDFLDVVPSNFIKSVMAGRDSQAGSQAN